MEDPLLLASFSYICSLFRDPNTQEWCAGSRVFRIAEVLVSIFAGTGLLACAAGRAFLPFSRSRCFAAELGVRPV